ncbi:hypothetical protein DS891_08180 [Pseudoalteromonas sp. JC28]|nr:hypothetical protein [Pseudoalteromonas sp. JC28]
MSKLSSRGTFRLKPTNCLRVIRNVWHFTMRCDWYLKVVCDGFSIALLIPSQGVSYTLRISANGKVKSKI